MPANDSNLSTFRTGGHRLRGYVTFLRGRALYVGNNATGSSTTPYRTFTFNAHPTSPIAWDDWSSQANGKVVDAQADFYNDYTDLSTIRATSYVTRDSASTGSTLIVREIGRGALPAPTFSPSTGLDVIVWDDHRVQPRYPAANETFAPNNVAYDGQTDALAPVCNSGGPYMRFVDEGEDYATITFRGADSFTVDAASSGVGTHSWYFGGDCTPTTSTDANPTVQVPPISSTQTVRYVRHTFTDTSNGTSSTQYVPVAVYTATLRPLGVTVTAHGTDTENGWTFEFETDPGETFTLDSVPDGVGVCFWTNESTTIGVDTGHTNGNVKFFGFLNQDSEVLRASGSTLSFTCVSPLQRLREIIGFSQVLISEANAGNWQEMESLSVHRAILHLFRYFTTALSVCDFVVQNNTDALYPAFFVDSLAPLEQIRDLARAIDANLICDRRGRFVLAGEADLMTEAERSTLTVQLTVSPQDVINDTLRVVKPHHDVTGNVYFEALDADGNATFVVYPGAAPNPGGSIETQGGFIVDTTANDFEVRAAMRGARLDRVYTSTAGSLRVPNVSFSMRGRYDVLDVYPNQLLQFSGIPVTRRGIDVNAFDYIVETINVTFDGETSTVAVSARGATHGTEAHQYVPATETPVTDYGSWTPAVGGGDFTFDDFVFPDIEITYSTPLPGPFPQSGLGAGATPEAAPINAVLVDINGTIYGASNFNTSTPTWSTVATGAPLSAFVSHVEVDPFSPKYIGTGTTVNAYVATGSNGELYYVTDIAGVSSGPTWTLRSAMKASSSGGVHTSFAQAGYVVSLGYDTGEASWALFESLDYGATVAYKTLLNADGVLHASSQTIGRTLLTLGKVNNTMYLKKGLGQPVTSIATTRDAGGKIAASYVSPNNVFVTGDYVQVSKLVDNTYVAISKNINAGGGRGSVPFYSDDYSDTMVLRTNSITIDGKFYTFFAIHGLDTEVITLEGIVTPVSWYPQGFRIYYRGSSVLYSITDGRGVWFSVDLGKTWQEKTNGIYTAVRGSGLIGV